MAKPIPVIPPLVFEKQEVPPVKLPSESLLAKAIKSGKSSIPEAPPKTPRPRPVAGASQRTVINFLQTTNAAKLKKPTNAGHVR